VHGTIDSLFRVEWQPLAALAPLAQAWRALAENAIEPNVFYEPAFALAAQPVFGRDVGAVLVWSRSTQARLLGFFPTRIARRHGVPMLTGWTHPYAPLGTPLVDRDVAQAVAAVWLDHLANEPGLPRFMLIPDLPTDGLVAQAIDAEVARRHARSASFDLRHRALLAPEHARADYLDRALGPKKRKELRRQRRRLQDRAAVTYASAHGAHAIADALDDFLALEAGGWKGRAGTAARDHPDLRAFLETAVTTLAGEDKARIERLFADAHAIAALILLRSGATMWAWKIAYDEDFAQASPGVQLLTEATQALLDDASILRADSCATASHPMIDHIWRERLALADRLICLRPCNPLVFNAVCRLERLHHAAMTGARTVRDLIRR
jgi:CelD/BcsL family acetyltransferase involved in cellulose biosynthesis